MQSAKPSPLTNLFLTLFAIGGVVWLGASIARYVVAYDAFVPGTTELKSIHTEEVRLRIVWLFTLLGGWTGWSFAAAFVGAVGIALGTARSWKREGWLFMSMILFILIAPAQGWMIWQDYSMWKLFNLDTGAPLAAASEIIAVFSRRMTEVSSSVINGLSFLSALTIVLLIVWRPFRRSEELGARGEEE